MSKQVPSPEVPINAGALMSGLTGMPPLDFGSSASGGMASGGAVTFNRGPGSFTLIALVLGVGALAFFLRRK